MASSPLLGLVLETSDGTAVQFFSYHDLIMKPIVMGTRAEGSSNRVPWTDQSGLLAALRRQLKVPEVRSAVKTHRVPASSDGVRLRTSGPRGICSVETGQSRIAVFDVEEEEDNDDEDGESNGDIEGEDEL